MDQPEDGTRTSTPSSVLYRDTHHFASFLDVNKAEVEKWTKGARQAILCVNRHANAMISELHASLKDVRDENPDPNYLHGFLAVLNLAEHVFERGATIEC